jgi:hypothetical protein
MKQSLYKNSLSFFYSIVLPPPEIPLVLYFVVTKMRPIQMLLWSLSEEKYVYLHGLLLE